MDKAVTECATDLVAVGFVFLRNLAELAQLLRGCLVLYSTKFLLCTEEINKRKIGQQRDTNDMVREHRAQAKGYLLAAVFLYTRLERTLSLLKQT